MNQPTDRQFAVMCYLVLMNHHGEGIFEAHPDFALEKVKILDLEPYSAWSMLDESNKISLIDYLRMWGFALPRSVIQKISDEIS